MAESRTKDKAEKIRKEFEIKLKKLSEEKDRLMKAQKEHNKILKTKSQFERQMKGLKDEVSKMKETKVSSAYTVEKALFMYLCEPREYLMYIRHSLVNLKRYLMKSCPRWRKLRLVVLML